LLSQFGVSAARVLDALSHAGTWDTTGSKRGQALALTRDEAPEVQPDGAVQGFVRAAKSVEQEETCSHQSEDDQCCAEENDAHMDTCGDNFKQIWKN